MLPATNMQLEEESEEPKITFGMPAKHTAVAELREEDIEELLEVVKKEIKENVKPKGSKMKMDTVSLSLTSSKSYDITKIVYAMIFKMAAL